MTLNKFIFASIIDYYQIDIVRHVLRALYVWTWFIRKITLTIDFFLYMIMCLPESLIVIEKPTVINTENQKIKIISAINQSNEIITNKINLFLRRYWDADENNFNVNKLKEFLDITVLLITYLITSEDRELTNLNRIKTVLIEVKDRTVYRNSEEAPFGDVRF